jgi:hypothetical protein
LGTTVKVVPLTAVPSAVVMFTVPVVVPGIKRPVNCVPVLETTIALTPPMLKAVGLPRLVPAILINVPTGPLAGLNEVITGGTANNSMLQSILQSIRKYFLIGSRCNVVIRSSCMIKKFRLNKMILIKMPALKRRIVFLMSAKNEAVWVRG